MERLYDKLKAYSESDFYAFHMPGHKRNKTLLGIELPYDLDITEIDGFDDLHHADGILKEEQERAARVFGAEESHFLVNGSTAGILSAVMGCTHRGDKILVARHCHKSIYHAIYMNGLVPRYVYPEFDISMHMNGEISKEDVAKALAAEPDIKAVVIVSPNYDGVVSDVKGIAEVAHSYRIPLIVDEAHGPHFGFHPAFPGRANDLGADVVINSLHKTLPSLTQTAILHINGKLANRRRIKKYLDMLQSSSPSYIFMASLDACVDFLDGKCEEAFELYVERLQKFREELKPLQHLQILRTEHYDISKVVISTANANITSPELADRLRKEYHLEMEMTGGTYVLAMTTVADTQEGLDRLKSALLEIDDQLEAKTAVSPSCARRTFEGKRALLVEDNELNMEIAVEFLKLTGIDIDTAENGQIALDKILGTPENHYDIIFMDIQMPVMNGHEASRAIRDLARADTARIPIIALTANAFIEDIAKSTRAGMTGHIAKPLDPDKIYEVMNQVL